MYVDLTGSVRGLSFDAVKKLVKLNWGIYTDYTGHRRRSTFDAVCTDNILVLFFLETQYVWCFF